MPPNPLGPMRPRCLGIRGPPLREAITLVVNHQTDDPVSVRSSALPKRTESRTKTDLATSLQHCSFWSG